MRPVLNTHAPFAFVLPVTQQLETIRVNRTHLVGLSRMWKIGAGFGLRKALVVFFNLHV